MAKAAKTKKAAKPAKSAAKASRAVAPARVAGKPAKAASKTAASKSIANKAPAKKAAAAAIKAARKPAQSKPRLTTTLATSSAVVAPKTSARAGKPDDASPPAPQQTSERADLPPTSGYSMLVDGHFKSAFATLKQARAAADELLSRFPMLRVEIYDAAKKTRLPA